VARAEFDRTSGLAERGTSTQSALDTAQKTLLAQETSFTNLQNTLALYPVQRASTEATLAVRKAELAEAERALENTTIRAPFAGRVAAAAADTGQFIRTGEQLVTLEDVDSVEIVAAVQPRVFAPVLQVALGRSLVETAEIEATNLLEMLTGAGVGATVRMQFAEFNVSYPAEIVRFSGSVDSETGTIGMAVRVARPETRVPGERKPPLNPGSFVSVDFSTPPSDGLIAVPRASVHQDDAGAPFVYTVDVADRLAIAPVTLGPVVNGDVIVETGLEIGDRLVLSSPRPPIEGLLLDPVSTDGGA
jgi:RND family efflux transporter MFP subunit